MATLAERHREMLKRWKGEDPEFVKELMKVGSLPLCYFWDNPGWSEAQIRYAALVAQEQRERMGIVLED